MSLAPAEIAAVLVGLGGGYWLVSRIIEGANRPDLTPEDFEPGSAPAGRNESTAAPWWEVLGVASDAGPEEVSRAYKRRISEYHPDKVALLGEEIRSVAERKSKEINSAYEEAQRGFRAPRGG